MFSLKNIIICGLLWASSCKLSLQSETAPVISHVSSEQIMNIGDDVTLNCTIENSLDNFSVSWTKEGEVGSVALTLEDIVTLKDIRYSVKLIKNGTSTLYSLRITNLQTPDMGLYECQVIISAISKLKSKVNILINHPAYILEKETPASYTVSEGNSVELLCFAEGYPKPFINWKRENNALMPNGGNVHHGNNLKLNSAHRLDRGIYICTSHNSFGKPAEKLIRLEVEFAPNIVAPRPKIGQIKSYGIELQCNVEGYPAPLISWYKNGNALTNGGNYRITNIATANEVTNSIVRISSVGSSDFGDYVCNATNKLGQAESNLNLFESIIPVPTNY